MPQVGRGTRFFDYDSDGWVDLFVANGHVYPQLPIYRQPRVLHRNNRGGTFTEVSAQFGTVLTEQRVSRGVAFGDIDNDGDVDLVICDLDGPPQVLRNDGGDRKSTRLNSSHSQISYAVFCLKKKKKKTTYTCIY